MNIVSNIFKLFGSLKCFCLFCFFCKSFVKFNLEIRRAKLIIFGLFAPLYKRKDRRYFGFEWNLTNLNISWRQPVIKKLLTYFPKVFKTWVSIWSSFKRGNKIHRRTVKSSRCIKFVFFRYRPQINNIANISLIDILEITDAIYLSETMKNWLN